MGFVLLGLYPLMEQNFRSSVEVVAAAEVMRSLPREEVDDGDVLSFVKKNLCGKSYTHRRRGREL